MTEHVLMVLHSSSLRVIGENEALAILSRGDDRLPRRILEVDMRQYEEEVEGGLWREAHGYLRTMAANIRNAADRIKDAQIHYLGLAEIPHVVALGAYLGDERHVDVHDYDRDRDTWVWPETAQTLYVEAHRVPREAVAQGGPVVIRVAISNAISDDDVDVAVPRERLADVMIRPAGRDPVRGIVRSIHDVEGVRTAFRAVLAGIAATRPNADLIHLFIAAPVSVCFVIGQELHLRNAKDVQTYRFRVRDGEKSYLPAIRLTSGGLREIESPLTPAHLALARELRATVWPTVLQEVIAYADRRRAEGTVARAWFDHMRPEAVIESIRPFPGLEPIWRVVDPRHKVSPEPRERDYAFDQDHSAWRLSDRLIERFHSAAGGDNDKLRELIRLFLFHEYLHTWQNLTKYTAEDVGSFANCLERIDYVADAYALMHQLDFVSRANPERVRDDNAVQAFLADQIDLALRSFWAFAEPPPWFEWQERRLRRYLNWFWRRVLIRRAQDLRTALRLLSRQPSIEVAGLRYTTGGGRVFVTLNEVRLGETLEIGLVLEDGRFWRTSSVGNLHIENAMDAFARQHQDAVGTFFNSLYDLVSSTGGHIPPD